MSTCNTATMAKYLDLTPQRCNQLAKEGILHKEQHGRFHTVKSIHGYIRYLRQRSESYAAGGISLDDVKLRRWKADAETMELKLKLAKAEVVSIHFATTLLTNILETVQAQLQTLPPKLTPLLLGQSEYKIVEKILYDAISQIQSDISGHDPAQQLRRMGVDATIASRLAELEAESEAGRSDVGGDESEIND